MPCYYPMNGWRSRERGPTGKRKIVFNLRDGFIDLPVTIPCGQCVGCRLERSRQWAIRCVHESQLYEKNCFITLTYNEKHLPTDGSLDVRAFQLFMKRLRKRFGDGIRFFHCGEYGARHQRPHYHACLFNFDFDDKELWSIRQGVKLYRSKALEELWSVDGDPLGFCTVGAVTFESAAYVARYIMKKQTGDGALTYLDYNPVTGEIYNERKPEYCTMSRRPGIGRPWLEKFKTDVYPGDFVVLGGKKMRPPKYYDHVFELVDPSEMARIKSQRKRKVKENALNSTFERLAVREEIQLRKLDLLIRGYENGL